MDTLFEILKVAFPAIITGLFTFLITKYTYNKNRPLDKLEIAYNRIYYPLYILVKGKVIKKENINDINIIIEKSKLYLEKYNKYADRSTLIAFEILDESNTFAKKKHAFQNFKNNIYNKNYYLRRRLGYLEPNFLQIYTYSSDSEKSTFRILMEFLVAYLFLIISVTTHEKIQLIFIAFLILSSIIIIIECICKFVFFLYYKIRK